jgi:hypothetical protein
MLVLILALAPIPALVVGQAQVEVPPSAQGSG